MTMCQLVDISEEEIKDEKRYWQEAEAADEAAARAEEDADDGDPITSRWEYL